MIILTLQSWRHLIYLSVSVSTIKIIWSENKCVQEVAAQYFIPAYYRTFHSENLTQIAAQALMGQRYELIDFKNNNCQLEKSVLQTDLKISGWLKKTPVKPGPKTGKFMTSSPTLSSKRCSPKMATSPARLVLKTSLIHPTVLLNTTEWLRC